MTEPAATPPEWRFGPAWLFCPGDRPERFAKAAQRSDVVILDLEDAVAPERKRQARSAIRQAWTEGGVDPERTVVRVNGAGAQYEADRALVAELGIPRVMLAKAERVEDVISVDAEVIVLLESALGVENAGVLAAAPNVIGVMWGAEDLLADLGGSSSRRPGVGYRAPIDYARNRALIAAKAHGRFALDAVVMDIADEDRLRQECEDAVAVGFDATVAIHPAQVEVIRAAYRPSDEQIDWATRLFAQVGQDRGVSTFEGRMVDGPVFKQASRILTRARGGAGT